MRADPPEVGERVDILDEVPEGEVLERHVERGGVGAELPGAPRPVERLEDLGEGQPEGVRRPVGRLDDRDPLRDGAAGRVEVGRPDARDVRVDDEADLLGPESASATAGP